MVSSSDSRSIGICHCTQSCSQHPIPFLRTDLPARCPMSKPPWLCRLCRHFLAKCQFPHSSVSLTGGFATYYFLLRHGSETICSQYRYGLRWRQFLCNVTDGEAGQMGKQVTNPIIPTVKSHTSTNNGLNQTKFSELIGAI